MAGGEQPARQSRFDERLSAHPREALVAASILSGACLALLLVFTDLKTEGTALYADPGWDRHLYRLMAEEGLFELRLAPYCWRVLVPAVAGWSPFGLQASFMAITLGSLCATGPVIFATLRARGQAPSTGLAGVQLFYSLGWGAKFIVADFWIPDGTAILLVSLSLWAAVRKNLAVFCVVMLVGALTKEAVLLAAPTYLALNIRPPIDRGAVVKGAAGLLPAALVVLALRLGLPQQNGDPAYLATLPEDIRRFPEIFPPYNYWSLFNDIAVDGRFRDRSYDAFLSYTFEPLGLALPLLAVVGLRRAWRTALGLAPFLALGFAQLLFATDTERLIVMVAPALIILAGDGVQELEARFGITPAKLLLPATALFLLVLPGGQTYDAPPGWQAVVIAATAVLLSVSWWRSRRTRDEA